MDDLVLDVVVNRKCFRMTWYSIIFQQFLEVQNIADTNEWESHVNRHFSVVVNNNNEVRILISMLQYL